MTMLKLIFSFRYILNIFLTISSLSRFMIKSHSSTLKESHTCVGCDISGNYIKEKNIIF